MSHVSFSQGIIFDFDFFVKGKAIPNNMFTLSFMYFDSANTSYVEVHYNNLNLDSMVMDCDLLNKKIIPIIEFKSKKYSFGILIDTFSQPIKLKLEIPSNNQVKELQVKYGEDKFNFREVTYQPKLVGHGIHLVLYENPK